MRYHDITKDDMNNGDGLRVVIWLAGCEHHCPGCQNPITWDPDDGLEFDDAAKKEIFDQLDKDYISGITFSGGDPLHPANVNGVLELIEEIKQKYPDKTIWLYTGYTWEQLFDSNNKPYNKRGEVVQNVDVIVDGMFVQNLLDVNYPWAGSRNQRVILVQKTIKNPGKIVLY